MSQKFGFACNDDDVPGVPPFRRGGGEGRWTSDECINRDKPFDNLRSHPEVATDRDEIYYGQYAKYLENQLRKHLLAGEVLDFLEQEPTQHI